VKGYKIINRARGSRNRDRQNFVRGSFELSKIKNIENLQLQNSIKDVAANKALKAGHFGFLSVLGWLRHFTPKLQSSQNAAYVRRYASIESDP